MPRRRQCPTKKVDWKHIGITVVPEGEPNPGNPYSVLSPEARLEQIQALHQRICVRVVEETTTAE